MKSTLKAIKAHLKANASGLGITSGEDQPMSVSVHFPSKKSICRNLKKINEMVCEALAANSIRDSQIDMADMKIQILKSDCRIQISFTVDGKTLKIAVKSNK